MILLYILWFAAAISIMGNLAPFVQELTFGKKLIVGLIIIAGAPIMLVAQTIELILDAFLAEGWNNDDEDKFGY